jgi:hypothetical protein
MSAEVGLDDIAAPGGRIAIVVAPDPSEDDRATTAPGMGNPHAGTCSYSRARFFCLSAF